MAESNRGSFGSRWGFIMAAAGSAVGLGNIWKFPYITGENGGGLFVLIYLVCIAVVGLPIMVAEIMIGRAAQKQPIAAIHTLQGGKSGWSLIGWMGVVAGFVILSYYIVVAGWAMDYSLKSFVNFSEQHQQEAKLESKVFRATAPMQEMRELLADRMSDRDSHDEVSAIKSQAKPSVWDDFGVFTAAWAKAGSTPQAQARLLEDPTVAANIELARELMTRAAAKRQEYLEKALAHYAAVEDVAVRDEAETVKRRDLLKEAVGKSFGNLAGDGWTASFWATIFMLVTILIVAGGVSGGIERTCKILMPTLIILIIGMVIYGMFLPGAGKALSFVFSPDPSKLKPSGVLEALGHAFFTMSLGMGAMITYGSYQKAGRGLATEALLIALFDTIIALLACLMIFPITFSFGQQPEAGPGLVFMSMPLAFAEIGSGGMLLAIVFFSLLVFAALTSAISLLEVVCSYFIDEREWPRKKAAWVVGLAVLLFGFGSAWAMSPDTLLSSWTPGFGKNFFDTMDYMASNWMLPLGGLLIAIYAGWIMPQRLRDAQMEDAPALLAGWLVLIRFVAPMLVILVLLQKVGLIHADLLHGW
jgi:NSS family neurotransmitter:Na+ symporter